MKYNKMIIQIFIILTVVYIASAVFLYFNQKNIIYHPNNQSFYECPYFTQEEMNVYNNTRFYHKHKSDESIAIVYHGNAGRACERITYADKIGDKTSLVLVEYAGYAGDESKPDKDTILQDAKNVVDWLQTQNYTNINIIGESLGSSVASYHASLQQPDRLILIGPFYSMKNLANDLYPLFPASILLQEDYTTNEYLKGYSGNVLILHGASDGVIDISQSKKLRDLLQETADVRYVEVEDVGHNDILVSTLVQEELDSFLID